MACKKDVNGEELVVGGDIYWMSTKVNPCPMCGIAVTSVDDCGEFGNPECPTFGIGLEEYNKRFVKK